MTNAQENIMTNAQEWLDENYPKNGTCMRKGEYYSWKKRHDDYGKIRKEITYLRVNNNYVSCFITNWNCLKN